MSTTIEKPPTDQQLSGESDNKNYPADRPQWEVNHTQAAAIERLRDRGVYAWKNGSNKGGATGRMLQRLVERGFLTGPPYVPTAEGLLALGRYQLRVRRRSRGEDS
jgi:hypothetical protein